MRMMTRAPAPMYMVAPVLGPVPGDFPVSSRPNPCRARRSGRRGRLRRVRMRFGVFLAPYHEPGENPTLALERDLELIVRLDELGYDEAWVGEHHSTGWETIAAPEIVLAVAAERTRHIRLGTGVVSLPYHHPLMVADRIVLLDHLTRGRINFGVGPGGHLTDARMLGHRPEPAAAADGGGARASSCACSPRPSRSAWRATGSRSPTRVLQLRPYQRPYPPIAVTSMESPAGMVLAGRHGAGVLSLAVSRGPRGPIDLAAQWRTAEEEAERAGTTVDRAEWRIVMPVHVADTRAEAIAQTRDGAGAFVLDYTQGVTGRPGAGPRAAGEDRRADGRDGRVGGRHPRRPRRRDRAPPRALRGRRRADDHRHRLGAARGGPAQLRAHRPPRRAALPGLARPASRRPTPWRGPARRSPARSGWPPSRAPRSPTRAERGTIR